jgi:hypothetical protein
MIDMGFLRAGERHGVGRWVVWARSGGPQSPLIRADFDGDDLIGQRAAYCPQRVEHGAGPAPIR